MNKNGFNKPNIFYHNIDPVHPESLAGDVIGELTYFKQYLSNAIKSLDVKRYGMEWEEDERLTYRIIQNSIIKVTIPKKRILIKISSESYDREVAILNSKYRPIQCSFVEKTNAGIILELEQDDDINENEEISYGRDIVEWSEVSAKMPDVINKLSDGKHDYRVIHQEKSVESIILHLDTNIRNVAILLIAEQKVEFEDITRYNLDGLELSDSNGKLGYQIEKKSVHSYLIKPQRKLKGKLVDNTGSIYSYEKVKNRNADGTWILLKESEKILSDDFIEQGGVSGTFFDLLEAGDFEIWESPDLRGGKDKDGKIRVHRIEREDERILVEKLPEKNIIYPPKNTAQLSKQLNAVETLRWRPAPEHRNLLKLFEPIERVHWNHSEGSFSEDSIEWEFLCDSNREGTSEQRSFVIKAMKSPDFTILEGPPGSGKTTAISELIYQLIKRGKRILLCASTHVAIDNVLEKMEEKYSGNGGVMENSIVPLRIGFDAKKVAELIQKFHIGVRKDNFEKLIRNEPWFQKLPDQKKNDTLDELVIQSSNLVCGTTIGILQYPHFRKNAREYTKPEFDYLIIDEASKTTFQDYLVPAIYAKHWVLVGDIRQLSPSVDTLNLRMNLDGILGSARERALLLYLKLVFYGKNRRNKTPSPNFIFVDRKEVISTIYSIFSKKLAADKKRMKNISTPKLKIVVVANNIKHLGDSDIKLISSKDIEKYGTALPVLFDSNLIFVESSIYEKKRTLFPEKHIIVNPDNQQNQNIMDYRHRRWWDWMKGQGHATYDYKLRRGGWSSDPIDIGNEILNTVNKPWSFELAWRMNRVYELSNSIGAKGQDEESSKGYEASMHALLPPDDSEHYEIWNGINRLSRVAFPSILASIQDGVSQYHRSEEKKTVMSSGFPGGVKEERYGELTHQHRMHPDLSSIPRDVFYRGEKLKDVRSIIDKKDGGLGERSWNTNGNELYNGRFYWKNVSGDDRKNINFREIETILKELDKVLQWLKTTNYAGRGGPSSWTIMIISFYDAQRKEIRKRLQDTYKGNNNKQSRFVIDGVSVFNYTVDKVQGREADIVFLSLVRNRTIGFMDNPNRINVAITRAKYQLIVVGNRNFLSGKRSCEEWRQISKKALPPYKPQQNRSRG